MMRSTSQQLSLSIRMAVSVILLVLVATLGAIFYAQPASAADAKDFQPGRIIDDVIFYNDTSMNASQIQTFLNAKNPNCDTNGTQPASDWNRPDISHATLASYIRNGTNGYTRDTGFHAPPYVCLKDYKQNIPQMEAASGLCGGLSAQSNRTAAQIIKDVASACGINPQVLIVLLQKEQSLVTDTWPLNRQYQSATGFDCPDTAPCDPAYAGFFYQVYYAARQFKIYQKYPNDYNYIAGRTNRIYWHPDLSRCGSSQVYIENQATAALYIYTPYRPNQAALDNLYGTGNSCSSYGNRNFWRLFTDWFGSTNYYVRGGIGIKYNSMGGYSSNLGSPIMNERCGLIQGGCYQNFQGGAIYWTRATDAQPIWGGIRQRWNDVRAENGPLGYPTASETTLSSGGVYQQFQNGRIYWKSGIGAWNVHGGIGARYVATEAENGPLGYPTSGEVCGLKNGGCRQQFENGLIVWSSPSRAWEISGHIDTRWQEVRAENGPLGYPTAAPVQTGTGTYQQFQNGRIYWKQGTESAWSTHGGIGARYVALGGEQSNLGYPTSGEIALQNGVYQQFENGVIVWSSNTGAWELSGSIKQRWDAIGDEGRYLGYPASGEIRLTNGVYQRFHKGRIYKKDSAAEAWSVHGGIGEKYISLGAEKSYLGYPTSGEITDSQGAVRQNFEGGVIHWSASRGVWT